MGLLSLAYNSKIHSLLGVSPFLLVMGRSPSLPADLVLPPPQHDWEDDLKARFSRVFQFVSEHRKGQYLVAKKAYNGRPREFAPNSLAWFFCLDRSQPISGGKLLLSWSGPMKVIRPVGRSLYRIVPAYIPGARAITAHCTRLFPYVQANDKGENQGPVGLQPPDITLQDIASEPVDMIEVGPGESMGNLKTCLSLEDMIPLLKEPTTDGLLLLPWSLHQTLIAIVMRLVQTHCRVSTIRT